MPLETKAKPEPNPEPVRKHGETLTECRTLQRRELAGASHGADGGRRPTLLHSSSVPLLGQRREAELGCARGSPPSSASSYSTALGCLSRAAAGHHGLAMAAGLFEGCSCSLHCLVAFGMLSQKPSEVFWSSMSSSLCPSLPGALRAPSAPP